MRPSLLASSVSNVPLWPAGVAGCVFSAFGGDAGERNQGNHGGREQFVHESLLVVELSHVDDTGRKLTQPNWWCRATITLPGDGESRQRRPN